MNDGLLSRWGLRGATLGVSLVACLGEGEPVDPQVPREAELAGSGFDPQGKLLRDWGGLRERWARKGFSVEFSYLGEVLGNVAGGLEQGAVYEGLCRLGMDLDLEQSLGWKGGTVHFIGLYPHGNSLSERYVGDFLALSSIDGWDSPMLFEWWYGQSLWDQQLEVRLGWMAADEEFAYTDTGGVFMHSNFGWPGIIGLNVPSPAFPRGALGAFLSWRIADQVGLRWGVYDGDPTPFDRYSHRHDDHGVHWTLDEGALILVENTWTWGARGDAAGPAGQLKLGAWFHTAEFPDQRVDGDGVSLADPASSGEPAMHSGNGGIYLVAEQKVFSPPEESALGGRGLSVFARAGWAPEDRNLLEYFLNVGGVWRGLIPGRDADQLGLGVVAGFVSSEARQLARDEQQVAGGSGPLPDWEIALEATYQAEIMPGFFLQPVAQYILHPGGSAAVPDATVVGLRFGLEF